MDGSVKDRHIPMMDRDEVEKDFKEYRKWFWEDVTTKSFDGVDIHFKPYANDLIEVFTHKPDLKCTLHLRKWRTFVSTDGARDPGVNGFLCSVWGFPSPDDAVDYVVNRMVRFINRRTAERNFRDRVLKKLQCL